MRVARRAIETDGPVALMGGAYGNVAALGACLARAAARGCTARVFLGDATGCCGHSDETLGLLQRFDLAVAGNHEQQAAAGAESCGCNYADPEDERLGCLAHQLAMRSLSEANRRRLGEWPDLLRLDTPRGRLLLAHGSPERTNEFLYESELDESRLAGWLQAHEAVGLAVTHTGLPWARPLPGGRFAVNCGVTGKPDHDGDPAVHFVVLEPARAAESAAPWRVRLERVDYDHEAFARRLEREGVDPVFVEPLRTGVWRSGVKSLPAAERAARARPLRAAPELGLPSRDPSAAAAPADAPGPT